MHIDPARTNCTTSLEFRGQGRDRFPAPVNAEGARPGGSPENPYAKSARGRSDDSRGGLPTSLEVHLGFNGDRRTEKGRDLSRLCRQSPQA
jgi:thymidylate synthase ThyX